MEINSKKVTNIVRPYTSDTLHCILISVLFVSFTSFFQINYKKLASEREPLGDCFSRFL